jgi:arylsulfatase A-like enzyme
MPRTRRLLASQGTTMTQGLAPTPMRAPARASLLTGQYAHQHGVLSVEGEAGGFDAFDDKRTLPTWLQAAGYETMFAGKYLNGYGVRTPRYIPPGGTGGGRASTSRRTRSCAPASTSTASWCDRPATAPTSWLATARS